MENKYILALAVLAVATLAALSMGIASAHSNSVNQRMTYDDFGMMGMGSMMGVMGGNFVHDHDDIDWMREEMKEHMNFTDEEFDEMAEHCPMMRGR